MADDGREIATVEAREVAPLPSTPMELLSRALDRGADLATLEKLMDLQDRHERNVARRAFDAAVSDAKSAIPAIKKNRTGHNKARYADLGAFAAAVDPVLANHGLSYRFRSKQEASAISVTCVLSHRGGHSEETTLTGSADTTGNKNSIQAIGSTLTYLQRYSLTLALGLAASQDDDGASADGDEPISQEQLAAIRTKIDSFGAAFDVEAFCRYLKIEAIPDLRKSQFQNAMIALDAKAKKKAKGGAQ